jgi:hypothetical protein
MQQKRKLKRIHLIYYLLVFDTTTDKLIGHIVDITTKGVKLMSRTEITPGIIYTFKMILPEGLEESSKEVFFEAKSIWCKDKMYSDFYGSGFEYHNIAEDDIQIIKRLVDQFGYVE